MNSTSKTRKKRHVKPYTKGELNRLIDSLCHPFYKTSEAFVVIDGFLHYIIEQNPPQSTMKFVKYNLPTIVNQIKKLAHSDKPRAQKRRT